MTRSRACTTGWRACTTCTTRRWTSWGGARRRRRVLAGASEQVIEIGIGTGRNLEHYGVRLTGVDLSAGMLTRAVPRVAATPLEVSLVRGDAQCLPFPPATFDTVTATCVFRSVADPVAGLREAARVVRRDGRVLLLEHVRPRNRLLGWLFDRLSPLTRRLFGPEINRRTEDNVAAAGLRIVEVRRERIWREISAEPDDGPTSSGPGRAASRS